MKAHHQPLMVTDSPAGPYTGRQLLPKPIIPFLLMAAKSLSDGIRKAVLTTDCEMNDLIHINISPNYNCHGRRQLTWWRSGPGLDNATSVRASHGEIHMSDSEKLTEPWWLYKPICLSQHYSLRCS